MFINKNIDKLKSKCLNIIILLYLKMIIYFI